MYEWNDEPEIPVRQTRRCPKCGSKALTLVEYSKHHIEWTSDNQGIIPDRKGIYGEAGDFLNVTATCNSCEHKWNLRNILNIEDIFEEFEETT